MNTTAEVLDEELTTLDNDAATDDGDDLEASIPELEEKLLESEAQLAAGCRTFTMDEVWAHILELHRETLHNRAVADGG